MGFCARRRLLWLWGPVIAYMAGIFFVSSMPDAPLPDGVSDKSSHLLAYMGLSMLVVRALAGRFPARVTRRVAFFSLLITIGYGVTDEVHQMYVPGRFAELGDIYANALGATIGIAISWGWGILGTRKQGFKRE